MEESQLLKIDKEFNDIQESSMVDYLILGNSHSFALQNEYFPGSVKFASYGETIELTYFKFKYAVKTKNLKIDHVILPYDLGQLQGSKLDNSSFPFYWNRYISFKEYWEASDQKLDYLKNTFYGFAIPYVNNTQIVVDYLFSKGDKGQDEVKKVKVPHDTTVVFDVVYDNKKMKESITKVKWLQKCLNLAKENNIKVILLKYPLSLSFIKSQSNGFTAIDYYEKVEEILNLEHDNNMVEILDASRWYSSEQFRDKHHLNHGDVRIDFTKRVISELSN